MLKLATLLSLVVAAPAFAAADSAGLQAGRTTTALTARPTDRGARVAEAAALHALLGGLMRSSAQALATPERSLAALAAPDLGGAVADALKSR